MVESVLITGVTGTGGIGAALVGAFFKAGYNVIATGQADRFEGEGAHQYICVDLADVAADEAAAEAFAQEVRAASVEKPLGALINNAATQIVKPTEELGVEDLVTSLSVNVVAPFVLCKLFIPELRASKGAIINIGSVHAQATKPEFAAYATSKTALHGLTRALAVDLGPDIRVNTLAPAATATSMLKAGFEGNEKAFRELERFHPIGRIAAPEEIGQIAVMMASGAMSFMTGSTLYADGGILSRLHDPV